MSMQTFNAIAAADKEIADAFVDGIRPYRAGPQPVVLVYGVGSFGDVIQLSPLLHHLRQRFPDTTLLLVHPTPLACTLMAGNPDIDRAIPLKQPCHKLSRQRLLAEGLVDLIVVYQYVVSYHLPEAPHRSRLAPEELAFVTATQPRAVTFRDELQQFPHNNDLLWRAAHRRGMNMYGLMAWSAGFEAADSETFHLAVSDQDWPAGIELPARYVTVCNSAEKLSVTRSGWTKTLPADKMARLVAGLRTLGLATVQLGAPEDARIEGVDRDLRGRTTLKEAAALCRSAVFHLGPEGGITNLAHAVDTPAIVFFGATPPEFFALRGNVNILPEQCGGCWWSTSYYLNQCPLMHPEPACIRSISEARILEAARMLMASRGQAGLPRPSVPPLPASSPQAPASNGPTAELSLAQWTELGLRAQLAGNAKEAMRCLDEAMRRASGGDRVMFADTLAALYVGHDEPRRMAELLAGHPAASLSPDMTVGALLVLRNRIVRGVDLPLAHLDLPTVLERFAALLVGNAFNSANLSIAIPLLLHLGAHTLAWQAASVLISNQERLETLIATLQYLEEEFLVAVLSDMVQANHASLAKQLLAGLARSRHARHYPLERLNWLVDARAGGKPPVLPSSARHDTDKVFSFLRQRGGKL